MALLERLYFTAVTCLQDLDDKLQGEEGYVNLLVEPDLPARREKLVDHLADLHAVMSIRRTRLERSLLDDVTDSTPTGVVRLS